uniref:Claudin n=1 Tax=Biomphalaria glabrata TaxID=6526 RepID=A0A2C9KDB0_BIOGL
MKLKTLATGTQESTLQRIKDTSKIWRVGVIITLTGVVMYIIGFSTNWWVTVHRGSQHDVDYTAHYGLWEKCVKIVSVYNRTIIKDYCKAVDNKDYAVAAQVLCTVGLISCVCGFSLSLLVILRHNIVLTTASGCLLILGAMMTTVGAAVYAGNVGHEEAKASPDFSVFFTLSGCMVLIVGTGLQLLSARTDYSSID